MSSTSVHSTATNATFGIDKEELVQVALLQIHGGDGAYLVMLLENLIGVSSVHFCPICLVRFSSFSYISHTPQRMGSRCGLPVPIYPLASTSPRPANFELRVTKNWISLDTIVNSITILFDTFPPGIMGYEVLLLCFSFTVTCTTREHPVAIGADVGWIHFLSRDVQKCNELFLDSNKEGILSIALLKYCFA